MSLNSLQTSGPQEKFTSGTLLSEVGGSAKRAARILSICASLNRTELAKVGKVSLYFECSAVNASF